MAYVFDHDDNILPDGVTFFTPSGDCIRLTDSLVVMIRSACDCGRKVSAVKFLRETYPGRLTLRQALRMVEHLVK